MSRNTKSAKDTTPPPLPASVNSYIVAAAVVVVHEKKEAKASSVDYRGGMHQKVCETAAATQSREKGKYVAWKGEMDRCLANVLVEQVRKGNKRDGVMFPVAYSQAVEAVNENFGLDLNKEHVKNRLRTWRKQFGILKEVLAQEGFEWDESKKMVVADNSAWNEYIKTHPDAKFFHRRVVENYDQLCFIFSNPEDAEPVDASYIQSCKEKDAAKSMMWTDEMDNWLSKILVDLVRIGSKNKLDHKLKSTAYVAASSVLNERFHRDLTKDHVRNRLKTWRKQYDLLKELLGHDDFEWDETNKIVVAEESAWSQFIMRNPDARQLQGQVIDRYDEMCIIFGCDEPLDSSSSGDAASLDMIADTYTVDVDYAVCNQGDNTREKGKYVAWTEEMDRCLTEQLLEQVLLGNKPDKKFKAIAYMTALTALNEKFKLELTKENIINRLKTWRKQYVLAKELLSHGGFEWDERKKMVLASDSTWNDYIKRNPDSRQLWARPIENFPELCIIIGNEPANGNCATPRTNAAVQPIHDRDDDVENPIQMLFEDETRNCDAADDDVQGSIRSRKGRPSSPPCKRRRTTHAIGAKVGIDHLAYNEEDVEIPMHDLVEEEDIHASSQQTRAGPSSSTDSKQNDKTPCNDVAMVEVMSAIATNIGRIADALAENNTNVCLEEVFEMVQNIPGFDDDLILDACEYLSFDDKRARMFMKLNDRLREKWLLKRLRRGNS